MAESSQQGYELLPVQSKMARVALGWGVRDLAREAGTSTDTVARLERGETLRQTTLAAIRTALETAGVEFTNGGAPGVRLRTAGLAGTGQSDAEKSIK